MLHKIERYYVLFFHENFLWKCRRINQTFYKIIYRAEVSRESRTHRIFQKESKLPNVIHWLITFMMKCYRFNLHLHWTTTIFILNLALADFLYCVVNLPLYALQYLHQRWIWGPSLCYWTAGDSRKIVRIISYNLFVTSKKRNHEFTNSQI